MPPGYRLPYMQWFEDDFRGSEGVESMYPLERLMYRQLLAKSWASKDAPFLPSDQGKLMRLADCPSPDDWSKHGGVVLEMFRATSDGEKIYHPRQIIDYVTQLSKMVTNKENGSKGGRPEKPKNNPLVSIGLSEMSCEETKSKGIKNQNQNENHIPELEQERDNEIATPSLSFEEQNDGQEEAVKATKQIPIICQQVLKTPADMNPMNTEHIKSLELEHKATAVIRIFTQWALEHRHDEIRKPVSAFLREADVLFGVSEAQTVVSDARTKALGREIAYLTDNLVALTPKQKSQALQVMDGEGYTVEEAVAAFKEFWTNLDKGNGKNVELAPHNFVQKMDDLIYTARRKKQDKEREEAAIDATRQRMVAQAEEERRQLALKKAEEESLMEDELTAD